MHLQSIFFEEILSKAPAEIIVTDTEYRYLYVNPSAVPDKSMREWMIGRTNEEFCRHAGRTDDTARARRAVFEKVIHTRKEVEWTESSRDEDGVLQHYMHKVSPVLSDTGEIRMVIIYVIQITEKKEYEEKIRQVENRYRDLYDHSQALICTHDLDGRLLAVNPAVSRVLGYTQEEMVGRNIRDFIPVKHRVRFEEEYISALQDSDNVGGEFCVLNKEGNEIYLLYKNYRMAEPGIEPYVIGFSQDITDRVKMERQLRLSQQMTDEVARAKESFLAHMSHEIRTPMNGILGIASLLNKTRLDVQQRNYLQLIQESANNLLVIVNDILDLEKIVAGKLQLESIPFKIVDKIATTIQSFIYRAEEKELGLVFQNSIPGDLVVEGDPYRLSQVLNNILSNALKFTNEGHINIATGIAERDADGVVVEITVSDTGIGIGKERLRTIFEPFEQADATISRKYGGTGLGLAISKSMVEMQNGEMLVKSEEGKGSAFTIRVPYHLSIEAMQDNEIRQVTDYKSLGHRKILVAEDVELNQYLAKHILESWGFEVVIVNNGLEAVQAMEASNFDCILMDVQMPEMDGIEATQHIRRLPDPVKAHIPIIALTANALKGDSEKYLAAGMSDYLAKPFDEDRLFQVIYRNLAYYKTPVAVAAATAAASAARAAVGGAAGGSVAGGAGGSAAGSAAVNGGSATGGAGSGGEAAAVNGSGVGNASGRNGVAAVNGSGSGNNPGPVNGSGPVNGAATVNGSVPLNGSGLMNGGATNGAATGNGSGAANGSAAVSGSGYLPGGNGVQAGSGSGGFNAASGASAGNGAPYNGAAATNGVPAANGSRKTDDSFKHNNNSSSMTPVNSRLYDLSMVQSVSGGDDGFIKKMVALFIETVPQNVQDMKKALQEENWDQVGKTAHKLKSTIDSMGIKSIRQEIRTVEANAKQKESLQEVPALIGTIDTVIRECIVQLQAEVLN